jgi:hypothetical protein
MNEVFNRGHALVVGVGGNLPCTVADAKGVGGILVDPARCAYRPENVCVLTGGEATGQRIREELKRLAEAIAAGERQSTAIVYFSGHGLRIEQSFYLIPSDFDYRDPNGTALSGADLTGLLTEIRSERFLLLLDCCHAGQAQLPKMKGVQPVEQALSPEIREVFASKRGRALIASSTGEEVSWAGSPYSAFTYSLLEALCGMGNSKRDGFVRVGDLVTHVSQKVPVKTNDLQHPTFDFVEADNFEVAYYAAGALKEKLPPFEAFEPIRTVDNGAQPPPPTPARSTRVRNKLTARHQGRDGTTNFAGIGRSSRQGSGGPIDVVNEIDISHNNGEVNIAGLGGMDSSAPSRSRSKGKRSRKKSN